MNALRLLAVIVLGAAMSAVAAKLDLPDRPVDSPTGMQLAHSLSPLDLTAREAEILAQIRAGNVPGFLRDLAAVVITNELAGVRHILKLQVTRDYLAVGADTNFLRIPLTPMTAQRAADLLDCSLPTPSIVGAIWSAAPLKLNPQPLPPTASMTSIAVFAKHQELLESQIADRPHGQLIAGHKKDIVLAAAMRDRPTSVVIYGWHQSNGQPIQPLYGKHAATWVDYSHGIRLVSNNAELDGKPVRLQELLRDPHLAHMISREGPLQSLRYPTNSTEASSAKSKLRQPEYAGPIYQPGQTLRPDFKPTGSFGEVTMEFRFDPEVRALLNERATDNATNALLVIYALPNGNTIEQTSGHQPAPDEDWHFDIQHIAAQTRFVRERLPRQKIIVAYLEAGGLSWPAWRRRQGDAAIPAMVRSLQSLLSNSSNRVVLSGHSGGGSFIFGYLNQTTKIPASVERIVFLDANYAYTSAHREKLLHWLHSSDNHRLTVLAYNDAAGLLDGKPFVSAEGGTLGRSARMLAHLGSELTFTERTNGNLHTHLALAGRVEFLLRENPERKIWHTVQVERNGFIHALLSGTLLAGKDYEYLGERAYKPLIKQK